MARRRKPREKNLGGPLRKERKGHRGLSRRLRGQAILAVIPAYNEAPSLPGVLSRMPRGVDVLLVDDGSTDGTAGIAESFGARVLRHPKNMGQGAALITGFKEGLRGRYDHFVEMDADGQHDPSDIPRLMARLKEGFDLVIGSRYSDYLHPERDPDPHLARYSAPWIRRLLLPAFAGFFRLRSGLPITDPMSGYRAFARRILEAAFADGWVTREPQYFAMELFQRLKRAGAQMGEVPIRVHPRSHGVSKKGTIRFGLGVLRGFLPFVRSV